MQRQPGAPGRRRMPGIVCCSGPANGIIFHTQESLSRGWPQAGRDVEAGTANWPGGGMADHGGAQRRAGAQLLAMLQCVLMEISLVRMRLILFELVLGDGCTSQAELASRVPFLTGWHLEAEAAAGGRVHRGEPLFVWERL